MHNFKPGDLAVIVGGNEEDLGKVVEILGIFVDDRPLHIFMGEVHQGVNDGSAAAFVDMPGLGIWLWTQKFLMPIHGEFDQEIRQASDSYELVVTNLSDGSRRVIGGRA